MSLKTKLRVVLVLLAALVPAASAQAAEITHDGSVLAYAGAPGESNRVMFSVTEHESLCEGLGAPCMTVFESSAHVSSVPSGRCVVSSSGYAGDMVTCTMPGSVVASLGDGDDTFFGWDGPDTVDAGPGNDIAIHGNGGDDVLGGGSGADMLEGGPGDDSLDGGLGDDFLEGVPGSHPVPATTSGADSYVGGGGLDSLNYEERSEDLALSPDGAANDGAAGEADDIGADVTSIVGGYGADTMTGNAARNILHGSAGDDALSGGGGDDHLTGGNGGDRLSGEDGQDLLGGGDGDDTLTGGAGVDRFYGESETGCVAGNCPGGQDQIFARDGLREQVNCGPGTDAAQVDGADAIYDSVYLSDQCESVDGAGAGGATSVGGGTTGGGAAFQVEGVKLDRRGRISVRLSLPGPGIASARATARAGTRTIDVGHAARVARDPALRLTIKPSAAARRALKARGRLKASLRIEFTPGGGGDRVTRRATVTLRHPARARG
jgi:hypothetical protein